MKGTSDIATRKRISFEMNPARRLQSPKQKYRPLVIVLAALIVAGLPLEIAEKMFGKKLCLRPKQSVKRRQPLRLIRKVVFVI
jgi:hypothetical protein